MIDDIKSWSPSPSEAALTQLVEQWLSENKENKQEGTENSQVIDLVIDMRYDASPETQLAFVEKAIEMATNEWQLVMISAGPLEDLLAQHGEAIIDTVITKSRQDPKFRKTMTGVWQNAMPENVWARVQSEKDACPEAQRLK